MFTAMQSLARSTVKFRWILLPIFTLVIVFTPLLSPAQANTVPAAARQASNPNLPTVFIVGDSTANNNWHGGWGQSFAPYFDTSRIHVVNRARAGRSSRTFYNEGLWAKVVADFKPGDFVLINFGHNDGGPIDGNPKHRGSLRGLGDETQQITVADGSTQTVHSFGWYMRKYIADARAKGVRPILIGVTVRNIWTNGKIERSMGGFDEWDKQVAAAEHVPYIDLTDIMADKFEAMGQKRVKPLFPHDHTHNSPAGGDMNAAGVVSGLKALRNCPLVQYLSPKGQAVPPAPANWVQQASR